MALAFLLPGPLDQLTGGYLYDRRIVEGLRAAGRCVDVIELAGHYPAADAEACRAAASALAALPDGSAAVIDGLALPAFADCLATHTRRLRVVGFIHHPLSHETGLPADVAQAFAALEARLWPLLRGVICPSAHTAAAVRASGVAADRIEIVMPGTAKPAKPAPARAPNAAAPLNLLTVGTVTPRKGHLLLIEALAGLRDCAWRLTCIGSLERDIATAAALREAIRAHHLEDRIVLAGESASPVLAAAYECVDLFVLPSYEEGYGMVYAEALAHGLPVIATMAGAIPETVPADASLLVPPGDVAALRDALRRVLNDVPLRARLAAGAARAAVALPDWPSAVTRWANALDRLIA
jgi:glycosyltransferase involved in cell wall biosynthesis